MTDRWALRALRWSYCAFIAAASAMAMKPALHGQGEGTHGARAVATLAVIELAAAVAFLLEPVELIACAALSAVYAAAAFLSAASGDWLAVLRFFFYGVTAVYIVTAHRRGVTAPACAHS